MPRCIAVVHVITFIRTDGRLGQSVAVCSRFHTPQFGFFLNQEAAMNKKTYTAPSTMVHGSATAITLGGGGNAAEGGSQLFLD